MPAADPDRPAVVLFTSGSEKAPKAVPLTHRNILSDQRGGQATGLVSIVMSSNTRPILMPIPDIVASVLVPLVITNVASDTDTNHLRYVLAYHASRNAGRCGPSSSDLVLGSTTPLGAWSDVGRSPATDFPTAPWQAASYVKVSIGFLCAAGLTGAQA